ncbi:MAG: hypothetical protein C0485_09915 [Pirellula sp.]|nr:hypothetical protein [Pirellula sp.]
MVALAVRYFWQKPVQCNARPLVFSAQASLDRGDAIAAGCKLKEAIRRWLVAECEYFGCAPRLRRPPSPKALARALKKAGHCTPIAFEWVCELIETCNKAARLVMVKPSTIASALETMHAFLDDSPYLVEATKGGRS